MAVLSCGLALYRRFVLILLCVDLALYFHSDRQQKFTYEPLNRGHGTPKELNNSTKDQPFKACELQVE